MSFYQTTAEGSERSSSQSKQETRSENLKAKETSGAGQNKEIKRILKKTKTLALFYFITVRRISEDKGTDFSSLTADAENKHHQHVSQETRICSRFQFKKPKPSCQKLRFYFTLIQYLTVDPTRSPEKQVELLRAKTFESQVNRRCISQVFGSSELTEERGTGSSSPSVVGRLLFSSSPKHTMLKSKPHPRFSLVRIHL